VEKNFLIAWVIRSLGGAALGILILFFILPPIINGGTDLYNELTIMSLNIVVVSLGMGVLQYTLLRKYLRNTGWWILASFLSAFVTAWTVILNNNSEAIGIEIFLYIPVYGFFLALCEWPILFGQVRGSFWWLVLTPIAWILSLIFFLINVAWGIKLYTSDQPLNFLFPFFISSLAALIPLWITGKVMEWMLKNRII